MRVQICSDIHIECMADEIIDPWEFIEVKADILILAGDIGSLYRIGQLRHFLVEVCKKFVTVLYCLGNQAYYVKDNHNPLQMYQLENRLYTIENEIPNLFVLNCKSMVIGDICFCGATLWSMPEVRLPKYLVRIHGITTESYTKAHLKDVAYIEKMIKYCSSNNLKLVVITHYCPTYDVLEPGREKDRFVSLYVTDLDRLLNVNIVSTWIAGHTHYNFDFVSKGGTRVVSNMKGKLKDCVTDYKKDFVIQV